MSGHDRGSGRAASGGSHEESPDRPRIKVTDRRRVHAGEGPSTPSVPETTEPVPGTPEPAAVGDELAAARKEAGEYREHLQRLAADFDNYRKRVLKEQTRAVAMASEPLVRRLLEVVDEFDLALMAAERKPDFDQFLRGVELVYAKLVDILRAEGLERIEAAGEPFDPAVHEALMEADESGDGDPYVENVLRPGYTLKGQVVRPAGVRVARR